MAAKDSASAPFFETISDHLKRYLMTNRLAQESSPYLLQHAENPVDWYPWGKEAFNAAQAEDKPIFLSIGYATCHWCHVMEHESFEDPEVASLLNEYFISIKVDREERPDIDDLYMTVCQMTSGQGGWPLSVFLTPERKPFLATTYLPKHKRGQRLGMMELLPRIATAWQNERSPLTQQADKIMQALEEGSQAPQSDIDLSTTSISEELSASDIVSAYANQFDEEFGGFGSAPKFPSPHQLIYLMQQDANAPREMAYHTLRMMRWGGLWDHVGFGFHRYATDRRWKLPHFEKMLYDQAMLLEAYATAAHQTNDPLFRKTAEQIHAYVEDQLMSDNGLCYSAEDADSEGEEGRFYTWTLNELQEYLEPAEVGLLENLFHLDPSGNFEDEATHDKTGRNVFFRTAAWTDLAKELGITESQLIEKWNQIREKLAQKRSKRVRPLLDDKILTDWNALYFSALAHAGSLLGKTDWIQQAEQGVIRLLSTMTDEQGQLHHRFRQGNRSIPAHADDYAQIIRCHMRLYQGSGNLDHLQTALNYQDQMNTTCWDPENGGYFITSERADLLHRTKPWYDGAIPSVNSTAASNLIDLFYYTGEVEHQERFEQILNQTLSSIKKAPTAFGQLTQAVHQYLASIATLVVVSPTEEGFKTSNEVLTSFSNRSHFRVKILFKTPTNSERLTSIAAFTQGMSTIDDQITYYLCRGFSCQRPVTDRKVITDQLEEL
jgi:uncharacterized protein YyaL (SSP411 family)